MAFLFSLIAELIERERSVCYKIFLPPKNKIKVFNKTAKAGNKNTTAIVINKIF